uniref:Ig-like domain-containing protein n=1 Tax=Catharus ustulatus TaxID=91951 RepID=A0A8C3UFD7_CATUS
MESTDSPEEVFRDIQQEPNTSKGFSFGKFILGLVMDDPVAQKEQRKESWDKKSTPTEEASENGEEMWEDTSAGPEPSAVQISELEPDLSLANYLRSTGIYETPTLKGTVLKEQQESITSLEVEEVTFSMVYDYYNNHQESARPFSPESEMSIELESGSREESPDSDRFYTPPSSVEIFETASSASYHTPLSTPERFSTPSEGSGYSTPPERFSTPSEGSVYSLAPERYSTPSESSNCNTPSEQYFTPFEGPFSVSGDSTPPERYRTPTGEYVDALTVLPLCERGHQPPDQPQANGFMTPCEAREPSGRDRPPAFLKALSRRRLCEGSTLLFVAEVVGVPKPGVKWYHNKSLLELNERVQIEKDGDKYILEITNVQKEDEGQYLCHAVNIVGEAKSVAEVEVLPEDGRSLALPPPQVKIITSPEFSPDKKSMVVSLDVLPLALLEQAAGFAAGENEDVKIDFQVTEMPPRFAVPITDLKVAEGLDAVFECVVTGTPVPVVQWFRGGMCVTPGTGKYVVSQKEGLHSLKVQTVGPSDSGLYRCQAMNRLGEATCKGSLVVMAQQDANAVSSETVTGSEPHRSQKCDLLLSKTVKPLEALPAGPQGVVPAAAMETQLPGCLGTVAAQVLMPKEKISPKAAEQPAALKTESLYVNCKYVTFLDFFSVSQSLNFRMSTGKVLSYSLLLISVAPILRRRLEPLEVAVNHVAKFTCEVEMAPNVKFQWYKAGREIYDGDKYSIRTSNYLSTLEIPRPQVVDCGEYSCKASNQHGSVSSTAVLTVTGKSPYVIFAFPPTFLTRPEPITTFVGKSAKFLCTVSGTPVIDITWQKDGTTISPSDHHKISKVENKHVLEISLLTASDRGVYTCKASNKFGADICQTEMVIIDKPHFIKDLQSVQSAVNKKIRLEWSPEIQVTWFKNNKEIHESNTHRMSFVNSVAVLDILEMKVDDTGTYSCEAVNEVGSDSCISEVVVKGLR